MKRLTALLGLGVAVLAVLAGTTATASAVPPPQNDPDARSCLTLEHGTGGDCLAVSVRGAISNGVLTASAWVQPEGQYHDVLRLQIDKLVVGAQNLTVLSTGPVNNGNKARVDQSASAQLQYPNDCSLRYHAYVYFSARMSDGRVVRDNIASSTIGNPYGPCVGSTILTKRATTHCFGQWGYSCGGQGVQLVASNDGTRMYGQGHLSLSGLDPTLVRVSVNALDLVQDGKIVARAPAAYSGTLRRDNQPPTETQTPGVLLPAGCATFQLKMSYSVRFSNGRLYTNVWNSEPYGHC